MTFATVKVEIAFDKRISETASDGDFTSVTSTNGLRQFVIKRGKEHVLDTQQSGTAIMVFTDSDGDLDPENKSSPFYDTGAGKTKLLPMRHIRIKATDPATSTTYTIFRGYVERWQSSYGRSGKDQIATCRAVDAFKALALSHGDGTIEAEEGSGQRIIDLITMSGYPIAGASVTSTTDDQTVAQKKYSADLNLLTECQNIDTAEVGFFFVDRLGTPTFKNRTARVAQFSVKKGTFTDGSTAPGSTWSYDFVDFSRDDDEIVNRADATLFDGVTQAVTANDTTSQADFGTRALTDSALMLTTQTAADTWALYAVDRFADPAARVHSIRWEQGADADDDRWAPILSGDIGEFYEVERTTPAGTLIEHFVLTERIIHHGRPGRWTTTWSLSAADTSLYWVLDDGAGTYAAWSKLGTSTKLFFG